MKSRPGKDPVASRASIGRGREYVIVQAKAQALEQVLREEGSEDWHPAVRCLVWTGRWRRYRSSVRRRLVESDVLQL